MRAASVAMSVETSAKLLVTMISPTNTNKYNVTPGLWWINIEASSVELTKPRDNKNLKPPSQKKNTLLTPKARGPNSYRSKTRQQKRKVETWSKIEVGKKKQEV